MAGRKNNPRDGAGGAGRAGGAAPGEPRPRDRGAAMLQRLHRFKQSPAHSVDLLGPQLVQFFKQSVQKRQAKFAQIADAWAQLVPEMLNEHCALESLNKGTLTVLVDSSPHLYELKQLLLGGVQKQLLSACKTAGLRKIALKPGRWYQQQGDGPTGRKLRFD